MDPSALATPNTPLQIRPFEAADWPGVWALALGAHVANAGYVVAEHCRRQGIGSRLCQHSLQAARRLGFRALQFNLVVSTNTAGIRCWQRNGFQVVGTLPGAFRHRQLAYVDALVMVQGLVEGPKP